MVALRRKGLDDTLKMTRVYRKVTTSGFSFEISSIHKNLKESWSSLATETMRKAFSMSAMRVTLCTQNLSNRSNILWSGSADDCQAAVDGDPSKGVTLDTSPL